MRYRTTDAVGARHGADTTGIEMAELQQAEREAMVLQHLHLVHYVANRVQVLVPAVLALEDYVSLGTIGLIDAVDRYQPGHGCSFSVFAYTRIRGAIWDGIRAATHSRSRNSGEAVSLDEPIDGDSGDTLADTVPYQRAVDPATAAERAELRAAVGRLADRDRAIVGLVYWMGLSGRQVAAMYGVTESRVCQLHARALKRLRRETCERLS